MEAHTLNAWTRFALQKGGIGSCTALVDNPATEPEDLMFMTGEKIIVLRRLDKDDTLPGGSTSKRKSGTDDDSWFLGYCEGVVGKFRASHVKIHGKLKKPVLMRRSGQGQIRESSTKFMSQAAAATLPESQVPVGIPVASVDSEGEDSASRSAQRERTASEIADVGSRTSTVSHTIDVPSSSYSHDRSPRLEAPASSSYDDPLSKTPTQTALRLPAAAKTTTTTTDTSRAPREKARPQSSGSDSDDSETLLPWARPPSTTSSVAEDEKVGSSGQDGAAATLGATIDSEDSPTESSDAAHSREGSSKLHKSPSHASTISSTTEDSDDDEGSSTNHRRDYTFSIYDVYGRDSVAFPNFNLRHLSKQYAESNSNLANAHPSPPIPDGFKETQIHRDPRAPIVSSEIAAQLRHSPSGKRPSAAPDPRAPPNTGRTLASNLRQQVEALPSPRSEVPPPPSTTSEESSPITPQDSARFPPYNADDPRRRPSGPPPPPALSQLRMPTRGAVSGPSSPHAPQGVPRPGQPMPAGLVPTDGFLPPSAPSIRHPQPQQAARGVDMNDVVSPTGSSASPTGSYFPLGISPNSSALKPVRSSSDRSSERERVGSGQLRKNPSNPSPGSYGGGNNMLVGGPRRSAGALSPPPAGGANGVPSRTPSPRGPPPAATAAAAAGGQQRMPPPQLAVETGGLPMSRGPSSSSASAGPRSAFTNGKSPSPTSSAASTSGPAMRCDAKGFFLGPHPPCRPEAEDREAVGKWNQILAENDLAGAKKSRKVRKLVQAGIPSSVRGKVWLFLANAGVRRRPGLFENLCRTSQEAKGKKGKEALYESIDKDVARTFPDNKYFQEGRPGRADLDAILKAYAHYNPIIGYTQGMGMLVGIFLLHMPPEDAFWMLCATLRDIHMEGYYSTDMKQMHIDGVMFGQLLHTMDADLAGKLGGLQLEPIHFTPNWFLPLFCRILPWPTLFPVWDVFFYEGPTWILQVALAVVRIIREPLMATRGPEAREECLRLLLHPPTHELTTANVLTSALSVKLKEGEVRKLSRSASKLVRASGAASGGAGPAAASRH